MYEKIFVYHISAKGPESIVYQNSYNLTIKRQITQLKKWVQGMNRHLSKEDTQIANKANEKVFNISNEK